MRYQDRIYNQAGTNMRNSTAPVLKTSSDICVFDMPFFTMSGGSKIECSEVTCNISGVSYSDIFTGATDCFITNELSGSCFNSVTWRTDVYEDNVLVYSGDFFTSTGITSTPPTIAEFSGSVVTAFNSLGYDYEFSGTQYTISQNGFNELRLNINTNLDYLANCPVTGTSATEISCFCPSGYTLTPAGDNCVDTATTAATNTGTIYTAVTGNQNAGYSVSGTLFYKSELNGEIPYILTGSSTTLRTSGGTALSFDQVVNTGTLWDNTVPNLDGRLNNCGIWTNEPGTGQPNTEWVGFSHCVDILSAGTYSIGLSGDNWARFRVDGDEFFTSENANGGTETLTYWRVLEVTLSSGKHIIEMEGKNNGGNASFGAEIYSGGIDNLTGMTTESQLSAVTVFTTKDFRSDVVSGTTGIQIFDIGESSGYSCPAGFILDTCGTGYTCTQLDYTDTTCMFTGNCPDNQTVVCDLNFSGLTTGDTNVHVVTGNTTIDLDFTFTANTSTFTDNNANFKFEVYKYDNNQNWFNPLPVYTSSEFDWSNFSGTSAFTTTVPVSSLNIDGDYLVKGYYTYDACAEFDSLEGNTYDTKNNYIPLSDYRIYQKDRDFHFVALSEVQTPVIELSSDVVQPAGVLLVSSQVLNGETNEIVLPNESGNHMINLNGITLANGLDYTINTIENISADILVLSGSPVSGDVLTLVYTSDEFDGSIKNDVIDIQTPIVSGITDGQGSELVYYNTTTGRYEIFLELLPANANDIVVTLNGVTLANFIDYYQSTSNTKRLILEGDLETGDIINIFYKAITNVFGNVTVNEVTVNWSVETAPTNDGGLFTVELSSDASFSALTNTYDVQYIEDSRNYSQLIDLVGGFGTDVYYRVKNEKKYNDLCGNEIKSTKYSDSVKVTIQTNTNNSY